MQEIKGPTTESSYKQHNAYHTYNYNHNYEAKDEEEASSLALLIEQPKHKEHEDYQQLRDIV
jgi:hypothetical protein